MLDDVVLVSLALVEQTSCVLIESFMARLTMKPLATFVRCAIADDIADILLVVVETLEIGIETADRCKFPHCGGCI